MKYIILILAAMLLLCLAPMPYGYYQLTRFASMIVFGVLAYRYWNQEKKGLSITFGTLALLFQPFMKVALGRDLWNIVDVIVAIGLIVLVVMEHKRNNEQK